MKATQKLIQVTFTSLSLTIDSKVYIKTKAKPREIRLNGQAIDYDYDSSLQLAIIKIKAGTAISLTMKS